MPTISSVHYEAAYRLAKDVRDGKLTEAQAAGILAVDFGMDRGSAYGYVRQLELFLSGTAYKRTINDAATRYYLQAIAGDFGSAALGNALKALNAHIEYYELKASRRPSLRKLSAEFSSHATNLAVTEAGFQAAVDAASALPTADREKFLPETGHKPESVMRTVKAFVRNAFVVAEALRRANGHCERCGNPAPFTRKSNGQPFLEVHHKHTLANGGDDTLANVLALCPNCHRELHYG